MAVIGGSAGLAVVILGFFSYQTLSKLKNRANNTEVSQEQFSGAAQVSEFLQAECQRSAEKISKLSDATLMFEEFKQNAENCREVFFNIEGKTQIRSEGMYPDVVVDIALLAVKTNKPQAIEVLNFAKSLNAWEFYMGPVVCDSLATVEAYLESINQPDEKICFNSQSDKEKLFTEIKNKNFSILSKSLNSGQVVSIGSQESEEGCPEKISAITKIAQEATSGNLDVVEEQGQNAESGGLNFIFKTKTEDKLILEFAAVNDCLQLQSVLIPDLQTNE